MRKIAIIGSTGSIGTQALDLCAKYPDRFSVTALTARTSKDLLFDQVRRFRPKLAGLAEPIPLSEIPSDLRFCEWVFGDNILSEAAASDCDDVLVSVVGMVGLSAVMEAFRRHRRVLLANKEALVAGGHLVMEAAAREGKNRLLPVDSEHSAIFQCLQAANGNPLARIALTCSGGPFRGWTKERIRAATVADALKHPTWVMGRKITVDSATLFNKGLEMLEAGWLFHASANQLQVLIHPQSIVHSGVYFADGALLAQLGVPDMHLPILYAMSFPERLPTGGASLTLSDLSSLTFEAPDEDRFPSLRLARCCMQAGGACGCVLNAANEVAVSRFLNDPLMPVSLIYDTVEEVLSHLSHLPASTLEDVLYADRLARQAAGKFLSKHP